MSAVSCIHTPPPTYKAGVNAFSNISTYHAAFASGSRACSTYGTCISSSSISTVVPNVHAPPTAFSAPSLGSMIARPRPTRCTVHPSSGSTLGPLSAEGPLGSHSTTRAGARGPTRGSHASGSGSASASSDSLPAPPWETSAAASS